MVMMVIVVHVARRSNTSEVSVAEAKRELSQLLGRVRFGGETIVITRRGRPMARLVPAADEPPHLADVQGWLDEDDAFFSAIEERVATRQKRPARVLRPAARKR
jgi:prevent-host-death family protein